MENAVVNNDKELWRETEGDAYSPSIHVTAEGKIGINVGGTVFIRDIRSWHRDADVEMTGSNYSDEAIKTPYGQGLDRYAQAINPQTEEERKASEEEYKYKDYLGILLQLHQSGHDCHTEINKALEKLQKILFK